MTYQTILFYFFGFFIFLPAILQGLMILGLILWRTRFGVVGRRLVVGALISFLIINITPIGRWILTYLENAASQSYVNPTHKDIVNAEGLILLGGIFSLGETKARKEPVYNKAAGRLFEFIYLAQKNPHLPIVFSGTSEEAIYTKQVFDKFGIDPLRVRYENQSKNTRDNAQKTATLLSKEDKKKEWVLVTSAFHLPRSLAFFRKEGIQVIPYPSEYHTSGTYGWNTWIMGHSWITGYNTYAWFIGMRELAGIISIYLEEKFSK